MVPDLITFNACISACARASEAARAWALLRGLRRRALAPDAVSFTAALSAGPGGGAASALGVVEEMRRAQVRPNRLTCTALVSSLKESGLEVLQGMKRGGMEVDMVTYAAVLTSMERCQQWQEMPGMCEEMQQACLPRTCSHSADAKRLAHLCTSHEPFAFQFSGKTLLFQALAGAAVAFGVALRYLASREALLRGSGHCSCSYWRLCGEALWLFNQAGVRLSRDPKGNDGTAR